jgi:hypothetical protein
LQCCFVYAGVISDFASNYSVPVWIDQWGLRASAVGGDATQNQYMTDILAEFTERKFHWTYWCAKRTPPLRFANSKLEFCCYQQRGIAVLNLSRQALDQHRDSRET